MPPSLFYLVGMIKDVCCSRLQALYAASIIKILIVITQNKKKQFLQMQMFTSEIAALPLRQRSGLCALYPPQRADPTLWDYSGYVVVVDVHFSRSSYMKMDERIEQFTCLIFNALPSCDVLYFRIFCCWMQFIPRVWWVSFSVVQPLYVLAYLSSIRLGETLLIILLFLLG